MEMKKGIAKGLIKFDYQLLYIFIFTKSTY